MGGLNDGPPADADEHEQDDALIQKKDHYDDVVNGINNMLRTGEKLRDAGSLDMEELSEEIEGGEMNKNEADENDDDDDEEDDDEEDEDDDDEDDPDDDQ